MNFESHYKDLFSETTDLIQFVSISGTIEQVNPSWLLFLQYGLEEVVGKNIYDFIHPEHMYHFKVTREKVILTGEFKNINTVFISKTGQKVYVEGQISVFSDNNKPSYTRAVFKNITQSRLAGKKLEENEKRLNILFQQAPDAIIVINQNQTIVQWNPKAELIFGFSSEEITGKSLSDTIIPHQYREAHNQGMKHFLNTGDGPVLNKTIEITALHKNGKEFFISLSISGVKLDGEWIFIGFLSDISERKRTGEALIYKEAELLQAKLLEHKKNEFISIASHELKTPLTTIKAYTQIALACDDIPEKVFGYLEKADHYTDKLNNLINELLDVSKIEAGKLKLSTTSVDMSFFLSETLKSLQYITASHQIILKENASVLMNIDILRLEQVVSNMISNAVKYSPGKKYITVNSKIFHNEVVVSFTDYGIGILTSNLSKVFNRFYREHDNVTQFSGLGIGLYVSSEIVRQHDGKIWVESDPGKGSTFYFSLPISVV